MTPILDALANRSPDSPSVGTTLLALVVELSSVTDSAEEAVERVHRAIEDGEIHLIGNFRDCPFLRAPAE